MSKVELTETQKNIIQIRKRMNRRAFEEEKFNGFTKEKMWTYLWVFLFTPYGIYRLFDKKNEFLYQQKVAWLIVAIVYMVCIINQWMRIF
ncbi:hypothetical protein NMU03_07970 [Allocoprobacillus halotolerans]|uniref:Uncharacterized protein n=1 Tax=Allocoprobacillus halotolerans TaxID=2944914 RepID=A0ABY5I9R3_9FIRM|nr:hypothetical protein [Allocoprobacillus halotolerans]UTY40680.1 hypothetical protein NMU03_07970 [Allocoprobacillus halotolerans]